MKTPLPLSLILVLATTTAFAGELPGLRPDGSVLLPNQWSLRPAGRQIALGDFPVNIAVHPKGRYAAILHSGHSRHEIIIVDYTDAKASERTGNPVLSRTPVRESFYGLTFSADGRRLYCSGGGDEVIHVYDFKDGQLTAQPDIHLRDANIRGIPGGMAVTRDGRRLFTANVWGQSISPVDLMTRTNLGDIFLAANAAAHEKVVDTNQTVQTEEQAALTKRAEAPLDPAAPDAPYPYTCLLDEKHGRLYVSLWAQSCVAVLDLKSLRVLASWPTQEHPTEMVMDKSARHLFVANANRNTVTILDTSSGKTLETLDSALSPTAPPGSTPTSLALTPDNKKLFVANANNNNIAVFDVSSIGHSKALGFIPVGWYPTSVRVSPDGKQLLVANGKGLTSLANPDAPQPGHRGVASQYIGDLFLGALSVIDLPSAADWTSTLAVWTAQSYQCAPQPGAAAPPVPAGNPVPLAVGQPSPIKYCIYIIKENRTYDQMLGDMPQGNGDPKLCIFPTNVTPNHHKLSADFVLLDNFYVDASVSADGHEWSMGAYASDFVEKTWRMNYGHNRNKKYPYPSEGDFLIAPGVNGYIWDRAKEAGVTYRSYGEFIIAGKRPGDPNTTKMPALQGHIDPEYHGFNTSYPDQKRADRFISELHRFETEGDMPRLQIVRLPNDHTAGTTVGGLTPSADVADNDLALGRVVEAVSQSKFWPRTAIFVLEDDAQNGPDHVDAHRSPAFVISPYVRRGSVDSTMYSTSSMLHTMELILGLKPMTQFDAAAQPMFHSFQASPDLQPYKAAPAQVDLNARNSRLAWGGDASQKMDFSREDAIDEMALNQIIWHSVRGPDVPMPAPRHAAFVFDQSKPGDDDD